MNWVKLIDCKNNLERGCLIKFKSAYPFENEVVMMVCEEFSNSFGKCLITITGYKAGINCYLIFPKEALSDTGVNISWLIKNWFKWVWEGGDINDVYICDQIRVSDL